MSCLLKIKESIVELNIKILIELQSNFIIKLDLQKDLWF